MNSNTVSGFSKGTGRNQIPALAVPNATEIAALVGTDTGTTTAVLALPLQTSIVGAATPLSINANPSIIGQGAFAYGPIEGSNAPFFNSGSFDGRPFQIRIAGTATVPVTASQTLSFGLRLGTTVAGSVVVAATQAATVAAGGNFNFFLTTTLIWDSVSQKLTGISSGNIAGVVAAVTETTIATGVVSPASLSFVPTVALGVAGTATVNFSEIALDLV